jgi:hypothetical protein
VDNEWLWWNTLSAINNIYDQQKQDSRYGELTKNESKFKLMYESINLQEDFLKDSKNLNLLKWNYKPELYLK